MFLKAEKRHYVASATMRRRLSALIMAAVIVCGTLGVKRAVSYEYPDSLPTFRPIAIVRLVGHNQAKVGFESFTIQSFIFSSPNKVDRPASFRSYIERQTWSPAFFHGRDNPFGLQRMIKVFWPFGSFRERPLDFRQSARGRSNILEFHGNAFAQIDKACGSKSIALLKYSALFGYKRRNRRSHYRARSRSCGPARAQPSLPRATWRG